MDFPDRDMAMTWVGRTLVDRDGAEIGSCTAVFADDATALTEWICSEFGGTPVFIPAVGATESGERVQVSVLRADVAVAPPVGGSEHITADEEAALYKHYGIPTSRDASPSLLPSEDAELPSNGDSSLGNGSGAPVADTSASNGSGTPTTVGITDTTPDDADTAAPGTEDATTPGLAQSVTPATAESDTPSVTPDSGWTPSTSDYRSPTPELVTGPADERTSPKRVAVPAAGLAALAVAVGLVLRARRKPPTRTERLARRGRAASGAIATGTAKVATPVVATTTRVARNRGAAAGLPAVALALTALRRRRARQQQYEQQPPRG